ncbi:MAG: tetratricopeptide repeat protein [Bacteroidetes bacterium]|nr:tetratricopeptide repeat protein [Bacteroidota bacterium]HET6245944.1 tetratricopeptide repeat protein [Bacteroidia bacterium]
MINRLRIKLLVIFCLFVSMYLTTNSLIAQDPIKVDSLLKVLKTTSDGFTKNKVLNELAWENKYSDPLQSLKYAKQALAVGEKINNKVAIAASLSKLGAIYYLQGEYSVALTHHFKSMKILEEINDLNGMASSFNNIGIIYEAQKNYSEAMAYHSKSLTIREKQGDKNGIAACLINIGNINYFQSNYALATEYYLKALPIAEQMADQDKVAGILSNIGSTYLDRKMFRESLEYHKKALKIREQSQDKFGMASSLVNIGSLYTGLGDYKNAFIYIQKSLDLSNEIGAKDIVLESYQAYSDAYSLTDNCTKAFDYYKLYSQVKDSLFNIESSNQIAEMQTQYETEKKEKEIALLTNDKKLQLAEIKKQTVISWSVAGGGLLVMLLAIVAIKGYAQKKRANSLLNLHNIEISEKKKIIEGKNKDITDSINYAKRIQEAILPPDNLVKQLLPDSFIFYKPKDIVSGDFYWMERDKSFNFPSNQLVFLAAADCTGHGVPGAMVSVVCSNALNRTVKEFGITEPGKILDKVRELVIETFEKSESEVRDGMDISLCSFNVVTNELKWAGANNALWILSKEGLNEIKPDKQPIGKYSEHKSFTTHTIQINKGETFYLFTDGYADQFGGEKGKKFKYAQFKELLIAIQEKEMHEQAEILDSKFEQWKGKHEQVDDVCVIGVRG